MRPIRPVTALLFLSCAPQGEPTAGASTLAAPGTTDARWMQEVSARIRDASHAFAADGGGFLAAVPEQGTTGRFDGDGAHLTVHDDVITVRTTGFGRDSAEATTPMVPGLGACLDDMVEPGGDCVRRLESIGADVTEWWASRPGGFEQGWTVPARPAGEGALSLEVSVEGAEVTVGEGEVWLQGDVGALLRVEGLSAYDADGVVLEARFEPTAEGFRVRVEDAGARYPVEIDPVYTTPSWTAVGSGAANFGRALSGAGDVNADGYDDVIVGAPGSASSPGHAYVYLGSATGLSTVARWRAPPRACSFWTTPRGSWRSRRALWRRSATSVRSWSLHASDNGCRA